jgi:hypothetical protein
LRPQHFAEAAKEETKFMSEYNPAELRTLLIRCSRVLGSETYERVVGSPQRSSGFYTALDAAIKYNDGEPSKVPDIQIEGALDVALEVWPFELEEFASANREGGAS